LKDFEKRFFDIRSHKPQKGQVMARFRAVAELVDGGEKRQLITMLLRDGTAISTSQLMRKLCHANELESYSVPRKMAEDLLAGMPVDEVAAKPYEYMMEMYYYTEPDNVPKDDERWDIIKIINMDDFLSIEGKCDAISQETEKDNTAI